MDRRHGTPDSQHPIAERRGADRRTSSRLSLSLEIAVPVRIESETGLMRGLARNISEGGMLIEVSEAPPIGSRVKVAIAGIKNSTDAPEEVILEGEIRHHMAWQYTKSTGTRTMRGIGIRFVEEVVETRPLTDWVWSTGHTVH